MARTDKDLPYWVKALHDPQSEERHVNCEHDPLPRHTRSHVIEHEIPVHWYRKTYLVPIFTAGDEKYRAGMPVYDEALDCYYCEVEKTEVVDGETVTTTSWRRMWSHEVAYMRPVTRWVFEVRIVRSLVTEIKPIKECDLDAPSTRYLDGCRRYGGNPPGGRCYERPKKDRRRVEFYGPERAHVRDILRAAADDYNTYGETDSEPDPRQHRHATWAGGYWF